jgi:two-component system sensor histidine kinase YesM
VREIETGKMDTKIKPSGTAEVQNLGYAIYGMLRQINNLMDAIVLEHELKRKSELDALQSQITPHFLYNALDSAVWMIERGKTDKAAIMVTSISKLFRIGISKGNNIITIENEIEHAKNYLTIQNIRFRNKFEYKITVADDVKNKQTIKLIVQPIIENAIHHGMEYLDEGEGLVKIDVFSKKDDVIILVSDNGSGMAPSTVEGLLKAPDKKGKGSGIGLYNVQKRIQLYYGEKYGLSIASEPDEGTCVTIRLPKKEMPKDGK